MTKPRLVYSLQRCTITFREVRKRKTDAHLCFLVHLVYLLRMMSAHLFITKTGTWTVSLTLPTIHPPIATSGSSPKRKSWTRRDGLVSDTRETQSKRQWVWLLVSFVAVFRTIQCIKKDSNNLFPKSPPYYKHELLRHFENYILIWLQKERKSCHVYWRPVICSSPLGYWVRGATSNKYTLNLQTPKTQHLH